MTDVNLVARTFDIISTRELAYRGLIGITPREVLMDSFETACLIGMRGHGSEKEFAELLNGIRKMAGFVYAEHFTLDSAIVCAAKVACMTALISKGIPNVSRFDPRLDMSHLVILNPVWSRLNKIKKTSPEAFYYFYQAVGE